MEQRRLRLMTAQPLLNNINKMIDITKMQAFLGGEFKLVVTFALLLVLLMVRPYGLFGTHEIERL